jgi:ribosomal protein S18 acetylase RimI-like enzyme
LSELNHSFDQMHLLHSLNLSFNALTSFSIAPLASLSHLDLSNNFLTALDPSINTLEELISLNLSSNTITTLHIKHGFELLDKLDLSSNSMLELSLSGCEMLERLSIDDNPGINVTFAPNFAPALLHYSAIGCEFSRWCTPPSKALHTLAMASNNLTSVHVHDYHKLCELDLEENAIEYLYDELRHLKHLDTLFIDANPLHDEEYARIASLGILHCDIDIKSSILIDVARSEDIDAMARLLAQLFAIEQDFTIDFEIQKQGLHQLIKHPGAILHVARLHDRVVGMITMQELISTAQGGAIGAIEDLVVDNAFRNFGIGYKLLESMIEKAKQLQYGRVQLSADMHNERALAFYRRYGFLKTRLNAYHYSL